MNEHETLTTEIKAAVSRLQPHEVEALAAHLERVGFRLAVDTPETVSLEGVKRWVATVNGHPKLGVHVLSWNETRPEHGVSESWYQGNGEWVADGGWIDVTHWQPLPPSPTNPDKALPGTQSGEGVCCANCKEAVKPCACERNRCILCGGPVGNITFSRCDDCWNRDPNPAQREGS